MRKIISLYRRGLLNSYYFEKWDALNHVAPEKRRLERLAFIIPFFYPLVLVLYFFKAIYHSIHARQVEIIEKNVFLGTSVALKRVASHAGLMSIKKCWIPIPFETINEVDQQEQINTFSLCTYNEIVKSFICSLYLYYKILFKDGFRNSIKTLFSFKSFIFYYAACHVDPNSTLFFCNHKDIWSIIIDGLPVNNKHLIQHGTEIIKFNNYNIPSPDCLYNKEFHFWTQNVPSRLSSVTTIYSFSDEETEAMRQSFLSCNPKTVVVGYGLELSELRRNVKKHAVLIIGFYKDYSKEEEMVLNALNPLDITIFLKNHPAIPENKYDELKKKYIFELICGAVFPVADLVISYKSTLALQYESLGVKVLYYDNMDFSSLQEQVKAILTNDQKI